MAVQLIRKNGKQLELCVGGLEHLKAIQSEFGTCVCVGPYSQGKSFLLNLLVGDSQAFELGHSYEGCTKGVWLHKKPVQMNGIDVFFFDTEVNNFKVMIIC
jgi:hypothetical protein